MATANHFLEKEQRESHAYLIADLAANGHILDMSDSKGADSKIHFVYSCGIGRMLPAPTKDQWGNGGYTQTVYL